jgi:hypothetical protein
MDGAAALGYARVALMGPRMRAGSRGLAVGLLVVWAGCEGRGTPGTAVPSPMAELVPVVAEGEPSGRDAASGEAVAAPAPVEPVAPAPETGPLAPLPPELQHQLAAIRADPPPERLVRDTHYWISNEQSHFLWHPHVADVGGVFVGVATDQNYLLAAWAKTELLVLMDFDDGVAALHRAYGVIFGEAETAAEFMACWSAEREAEVEARLRAELPALQVEASVSAFRSARSLVEARLVAVDAQYRALGIATFLSAPEQYEHLRTLWRNGRVVAVRGDLTAEVTMADIAAALRAAGLEVGVLYLSNAEQYFRYGPQFRKNVAGLPMAARGVVLRTHGWKQFEYVAGEEYHYNVQSAPRFAEGMAKGRAWGVAKLLERRRKSRMKGLSILDGGGGPD